MQPRSKINRSARRPPALAAVFVMLCLAAPSGSWAARIQLKDGRVLEGEVTQLSSMVDVLKGPPADGAPQVRSIILVDDGLRRYFVPMLQLQAVLEGPGGEVSEKILIDQRTARSGKRVVGVGPILEVQPFDDFGRRIFSMQTTAGRVDVVQGVTQITPRYTKVEALTKYLWDMRIATNSLPPDALKRMLMKSINPRDAGQRIRIPRLLLQLERYEDARHELEEIIAEFPELAEQFDPVLRRITQQAAQRLLAEARLRRQAGQHPLVIGMLENFPAEGVAGELLQEVREELDLYQGEHDKYTAVLKQFDEHRALVDDEDAARRLETVLAEIAAELSINTLPRMAAYRQLSDDPSLQPEEKLALAVSGWSVGADAATRNLPVALSLFHLRGLLRDYLNEPQKIERQRIFEQIEYQEGATPAMAAKLLAHMKPPREPSASETTANGFFEFEVEGLSDEMPVKYCVQLPPNYDPYRRYPTIVTLHGAGTSALQQIDWWCGSPDEKGMRVGQAPRHGYIVIAPQWGVEHQRRYGYSAREHAAVVNALRDACRRLAIDTDRVFLSGHSMGGDAAWDMGLAHPDLWAGVMPIVARADRFCDFYWENGRGLPMYFVAGELDGAKAIENAAQFDRYLKRHSYDVTIAEFQGRGHEHFYDEILELFDWMGRKRRNFFPKEFECVTMRPWDNYFWWVELDGMPESAVVPPEPWPPVGGVRSMSLKADLKGETSIYVRSGADRTSLWFSPELMPLDRRVNIVVNGTRLRAEEIPPSLAVLLEDARTRADRQHPFWAKLEMPSKKIN